MKKEYSWHSFYGDDAPKKAEAWLNNLHPSITVVSITDTWESGGHKIAIWFYETKDDSPSII